MSLANEDSSYDIRIEGDRELRASVGMLGITITAEQVWLSIPDRYGHPTAYNFAPFDWARIVELINDATDSI
jgi:hypothetical protein